MNAIVPGMTPDGDEDAPTLRQILDINPMVGPPKPAGKCFWTTREVAVLHATWPEGMPACLAALPGRSASSIYQRARIEKLGRGTGGAVRPKRSYASSERIDEAIRQCYQGNPELGAVKRLAQTLNRPRHWISARAKMLGLVLPRYKQPDWVDAEIDILRANVGKHPTRVRLALKAAGFARTDTAILLKAKALRIRPEDSDDYTIADLAEAFGIGRDRIGRWIENGWLTGARQRAMRRPLKAEPHDKAHWRFTQRDVREFILDNVAAIDFRRVDKFWLVSIVAGDR